MIGRLIKVYDNNRNLIEGEVILIYNDALASGTNEYVSVTYILIKDDNGNIVNIRPRDIISTHYRASNNIPLMPDLHRSTITKL